MRQAPSIGGSLELCYWAKSSGHIRLSSLSAEGLKRAVISWLLCSVLRFLYLLALIRTIPLRTGYRSHCARFGWKRTRGHCWSFRAFSTGMFGGSWCWLACCIPQRSVPYVQMGHSIALYTVSLLSRDSCERAFISQLMLDYNMANAHCIMYT